MEPTQTTRPVIEVRPIEVRLMAIISEYIKLWIREASAHHDVTKRMARRPDEFL